MVKKISSILFASFMFVSSISAEEYIVNEGDSLYRIAQQYKVGVVDLKKANGLNADSLSIGQKLYIPK